MTAAAREQRRPGVAGNSEQRRPGVAGDSEQRRPGVAGDSEQRRSGVAGDSEQRLGVAGDRDLAERCRRGEPGAFEELYRAHAGRLYSLILRMAGSAQDAEDLLQEVFLTAHRKLGSFRGDSALGTWLYRMAVNHCLDFLRGRQNRMARATDSLDEDGAAEPADAGPVIPSAITRLDLERAIAALPPGCRAVFVLHDVEGLEHREIATLLGVSEGTSKSQVHKARMKLRVALTAARLDATRARGSGHPLVG